MGADPDKYRMPEPTGPVPDVFDADGALDEARVSAILDAAKDWPPEQKHAMLSALRAAVARAEIKTRYRHPAEIGLAVDPNYVITPAIELTSKSIETVLNSPKQINLEISFPPQEGKSTLAAVYTPIRALQINPNRRIILATYADALAETHSRAMRELIDGYGTGVTDELTGMRVEDRLGLKLARGANKISAWSVEAGAGGLVAAGIGSKMTGLPADLLIIDDPFKNMMEADSEAHRNRIDAWFSSVARTRLAPDASIIMIQTRWHPEDLAGKVIAGEKKLPKSERTWRVINIPAVSEAGIADALKRPLGVPMQSARDKPEAKRDFAKIRREVGERTFYALYQGSPRNPSGGIFKTAWFDPRLPTPPQYPVAAVVGVDPADSGEGDDAGVIGGMLTTRGTLALTHDRSGKYTSDQWAHQAVLLALEIGARVIGVEGYTSVKTYVQVVRRAYDALHREAETKRMAGAAMTPLEKRALPDLPPFEIRPWRGANKADAVARAGGLSQSLEVKRCVVVEFALATFEEQATTWQAGQHQPDRVAAAIIVHDILMELRNRAMNVAAAPTTPAEQARAAQRIPDYMRRTIPGR